MIILTLSAAKDLDALPRDAREQVEAGLHRYAMTGQGDGRPERAGHEAEDAEGAAIYDAWKAELAAGGVVLPPEVSAAMLRGESRLKAIRNWRGQTPLYLDAIAGITQVY